MILLIITSLAADVFGLVWLVLLHRKLRKLISKDLPPVAKAMSTDIPYLIKCAETFRDNDDTLAKNQELLARRIIKTEKQANTYKSKVNRLEQHDEI